MSTEPLTDQVIRQMLFHIAADDERRKRVRMAVMYAKDIAATISHLKATNKALQDQLDWCAKTRKALQDHMGKTLPAGFVAVCKNLNDDKEPICQDGSPDYCERDGCPYKALEPSVEELLKPCDLVEHTTGFPYPASCKTIALALRSRLSHPTLSADRLAEIQKRHDREHHNASTEGKGLAGFYPTAHADRAELLAALKFILTSSPRAPKAVVPTFISQKGVCK